VDIDQAPSGHLRDTFPAPSRRLPLQISTCFVPDAGTFMARFWHFRDTLTAPGILETLLSNFLLMDFI